VLRCDALRFTELQCTALCIALHCTLHSAVHFTAHCTALHSAMHCTHCSALHNALFRTVRTVDLHSAQCFVELTIIISVLPWRTLVTKFKRKYANVADRKLDKVTKFYHFIARNPFAVNISICRMGRIDPVWCLRVKVRMMHNV